MTDAPRDTRTRQRQTDNGRIARLADNPHWRAWPRVAVLLSPFVVAFFGWLLLEVWTSQKDAIIFVGENVVEVQESVSRLILQNMLIQRYQHDLENDVDKLETRVLSIEVRQR